MPAPSNHSNPISTIAELEAEIYHNQQIINQLQQRNDELTQELAQIDAADLRSRQQYDQPQSAPQSVSFTPKTKKRRQPQPKRRKLSHKCLSIAIIACCLALICIIIGFAITRLVLVR